MTAPAVLTKAGFDELVTIVQAALVKRHVDGTGYFEISVHAVDADDEGFAVWLCGRCGVDTNGQPCEVHDNDDLPGYYETWLRTTGGTIAGRCSCGRSTTRHTCTKHIRLAQAEREAALALEQEDDEPEVVR